MAAVGRLQPLETVQFKCACHRTTACRATRRERRAPEAGRWAADQENYLDEWRCKMNEFGQTWHYGLVARHWAENNTTGPEIAFYLRMIERYGQPALDAGCGTGRLLIPFLRTGLDVDGCDVSEDMLA